MSCTFTDSNITRHALNDYEPDIKQLVSLLVTDFNKAAETSRTIDLRDYFGFFSFDVMVGIYSFYEDISYNAKIIENSGFAR